MAEFEENPKSNRDRGINKNNFKKFMHKTSYFLKTPEEKIEYDKETARLEKEAAEKKTQEE